MEESTPAPPKEVNCENCNGACCKWLFINANPTRSELEFFAARGITRVDKNRFAFKTSCPQLKEGRCGIYEKRPLDCKLFKMGGPDCLAARKLEGYKD